MDISFHFFALSSYIVNVNPKDLHNKGYENKTFYVFALLLLAHCYQPHLKTENAFMHCLIFLVIQPHLIDME